MSRWSVTYDPKLDAPVYRVVPGFGHALLAPIVANAFQVLRVTASLWEHGKEWFVINSAPNMIAFEVEHGVEGRGEYNDECLARVLARRKPVVGEHGGYCDVFAPVVVQGDVEAVLVSGPFLRKRSEAVDILDRWRRLTGRQGHPADSQFAAFLAATQQLLVLDGDRVEDFVELVSCLTKLLAIDGNAARLSNRAQRLRQRLQGARFVDAMWEAVQTIVDERSSRTWFSVHRTHELRRLGLTRIADHVLVGLGVNRSSEGDAVDEAVRRHALQRATVDLAHQMGDVLAGQVGDHGVVFLSGSRGSPARRRDRLLEIAERAKRLGRQHGFALYFGACPAPGSVPLGRSYQLALGAAEAALGRTQEVVFAATGAAVDPGSMRELRNALAKAVEEQPEALAARFERYLDAVSVRSGHRIEPARVHLEVGFEKIAEPLVESGAVDRRALEALQAALGREVAAARNMSDVTSAYRRAIADLSQAVQRPVPARRDRSLRLALEYIGQHYTEPLPLTKVAQIAGFAPSHFSKLFIERERMSFEHYVRALRLERAKHLLVSTALHATRVAELSGFSSLQYFCHVFRRSLGTTPLEYRRLPQKTGTARNENAHENSPKRNTRRRAVR